MVTLMLTALLFLQAPSDSLSSAAVSRAQAWLRTTYPALQHGEVTVRTYGDTQSLRLEVTTEPVAVVPGERGHPAPMLVVDLAIAADGRVERMTATGPLVESAAREALRAQVAAHPEWTDLDVTETIRAAGGRYGADAPPARSPAAPGAVARTRVTPGRRTFVRDDPRGPVWIAEMTADTRTYQIAFEPFGGQVIGVTPK